MGTRQGEHTKPAVITGIFAVIAAIVGGVFLVVSTLIQQERANVASPVTQQAAGISEIPTAVVEPTASSISADLSRTSIKSEDLPLGFRELTESELATIRFLPEQLTAAYSRNFQGVQLQSYSAFAYNNVIDPNTDPSNYTLIEGFVISPLDKEGIGKVDALIRNDPRTIAEFFSGSVVGAPIEPLSNLPPIGDTSIGIETTLNSGRRIQIVNARRQNAWIIVHVIFVDGQHPTVNIGDAASIMDYRVKKAMGLP